MQKEVFISLLSGVLCAAFLTYLPFLALFLPILLYYNGLRFGIKSAAITAIPLLALTSSNLLSQLIFLCFTIFPIFIIVYGFEKRSHSSTLENTRSFGLIDISLLFFIGMSIIVSAVFLTPNLNDFVLINIERISLVLAKSLNLSGQDLQNQMASFIPLSLCLYHFGCLQAAAKLLKLSNIDVLSPKGNDKNYPAWIDIPVIASFLLLSLLQYYDASFGQLVYINALVAFSMIPSFFIGVFTFKKIASSYGISEKKQKMILFFLFFLVEALYFIVVLGLMESCCGISQRFQRKQF